MTRANVEGPFRVDLTAFPLVHMGSPNVAQYDHPSADSFFGCIDQGLAREAPFVILLDARGVPHADDLRRREFMRHLEARRARIERTVVAFGAICGSPLERGVITAFMWFIRLPLPIRIFGHELEARSWLLGRYEASLVAEANTGEQVTRDSGFYSSTRSSASYASSEKARTDDVA